MTKLPLFTLFGSFIILSTLFFSFEIFNQVFMADSPKIKESNTESPIDDNIPFVSDELRAQVEETLKGFLGGFLENTGQKNEVIRYYTQSAGMTVGFGTSEVRFNIIHPSSERLKNVDSQSVNSGEPSMTYTPIKLTFLGSNNVIPVVEKPTGVYCHYFRGTDPTKWTVNNQYYTRLIYHNIYEQIDLVYELKSGQLKYEFYVYPGGNPEAIQLHWIGPVVLKLLQQGMQVTINRVNRLKDDINPNFDFLDTTPVVYQPLTRNKSLYGSFQLLGPTTYGFSVPTYDLTKPLIIDPFILTYSTYVSGSDNDNSREIAINDVGNAYVTGYTSSTDFPTVNAYNDTHNGGVDAFVCKLSSDGSTLLYSTYVGGSANDEGWGIALDDVGNAYVTGRTRSTDFPTTPNAYDATGDGSTSLEDVFVFKLAANGSTMIYSTYVSGNGRDEGYGMAVDDVGNAYVTGYTFSTDFPTTPNAYDATGDGSTSYNDAFVFKLAANGSTMLYSTYVSGGNMDRGRGIAIDTGNAYVTGSTHSSNFPTTSGAFNETWSGEYDTFVCKLSTDGSSLLYSTYVGGSYSDYGLKIAIDDADNAYVTGYTSSTDFPTTPNAYDATGDGSTTYTDGFIFKLAANGSTMLYSTYVSGGNMDRGWGIAIDDLGNAYVTGLTQSTDFPTTPNAYDATGDGSTTADAFVCKLATNGSTLLYSTYISGSRNDMGFGIVLDASGNVYTTGDTSSTDFPTTPNAYNATGDGTTAYDVYIFKLVFDESAPSISLTSPANDSVVQPGTIVDLSITDDNSGVSYVLYNWDGAANTSLTAPYDLTVPVSEGKHILKIFANDTAGNWVKAIFVFTTDGTAPAITLNSPANETVHPSGITIDLSISDLNLDTVRYKWDAASWTLFLAPYDTTLPVSDGTHTLYVNATDEVGNWVMHIYVFTTDNTDPVITLNDPASETIHQSGTIIDLSVTDINGITQVLYNWDGQPNTTLSSPYDVTLPGGDGAHTLRIYARDPAGNWISATFMFMTDDTHPTIILANPVNASTHPSGTSISLEVTDNTIISQVLYNWDGTTNVTLAPYNITVVLPTGDGQHVLHLYVQDQVGNWASATYVFTTDDTTPTVTVTTPPITVTRTTTMGTTVTVQPSNFFTAEIFLLAFGVLVVVIWYRKRRKAEA